MSDHRIVLYGAAPFPQQERWPALELCPACGAYYAKGTYHACAPYIPSTAPSITITASQPLRDTISTTIIGPPIPWARARSKGRQHYTPAKQRVYGQHVKACLWHARYCWEHEHKRKWPLDKRYRLLVTAYRDSARRCDWDNIGKLPSDMGNGVLWNDDEQVDDGQVLKLIDRERPRLEVTVEVLT